MSTALVSFGRSLGRVARRLAVLMWTILRRPIAGLAHRKTQQLSLGERLRTLPGGSAPTASCSQDVAARDDTGATVTPLWPDVDLLAVPPMFDAASDASLLNLLQMRRKSKVLDLRPAQGQMLSVAWFERLATGWSAPAAAVPRLGIVLDFERWALWEAAILRALQPIMDHGVEVRVFYAQQAHQLRSWFVDGEIDHDLPGVLSWLRYEWPALRASGASPPSTPPQSPRLSPTGDFGEMPWVLVLRRIASLVEKEATVEHVPAIRLELAQTAQTFGEPTGNTEALHHLSAALYWLGDAPSQLKCRVLRAQAAIKIDQDDVANALQRADDAVRVALNIQDPLEAMTALADGGRYALRWRMYDRAERRLRRALEIATPQHPAELRADVQHLLARVLLEKGNVDDAALRYAKAALWLRTDTSSSAAAGDRVLLSEIAARLAPSTPRTSTTNITRVPRARSEGA